MNLTVACVLKTGPFKSRRYSPKWVLRLREMVERNLSLPHRFVCLTDTDIPGVETIRLRKGWPGYWSKIELFGPNLRDCNRVLYLDLDVLVTGNLDDVVQVSEPIIFCPPHPVLVDKPGARAPRGVIFKYQTSCMVWSPPAGREIYDAFSPEAAKGLHGDQDWIAKVNPDWPTFGREWFRKLRDCRDGPPEGVKVVLCMPEKNDVASRNYPWVRETWLGRADKVGERLPLGQGQQVS